ncbi:MAG: hypothetical protein Q9162_006318 [Coniocarpon cinnabarinum]
MPLGVASVGDIIAVGLLIKDLVSALNEARGSSHDFQQLVRQLQSLGDVLHQVETLVRRHDASPGLNALCVSITRRTATCEDLIKPFLLKVRKYQHSLKVGGSGSVFQDAACKMRWKICEADEVESFRAHLLTHTISIQALLEMWNIAHAQTQKAIADAAASAESSSQAHENHSNTFLNELLFYQGTFTVTDAFGERFPMHLQFVNSWEVFDAAMEARFRGQKGHRKILEKQFALQNVGNQIELSRRRPWKAVVKPGQQLDMEIIFSRSGIVAPDGRSCPGCSFVGTDGSDDLHEW